MSCTFEKERLSEYFDGELDAKGRAEAETHISGCSDCLRELGEIKATALLVKGLTVHRAPASVSEEVEREIAASPRAGRVRSFSAWKQSLGWITAAAAALLIAVNVIYFSSFDSAPNADRVAMSPPSAMEAKPGKAFRRDKAEDFDESLARAERKNLESEKSKLEAPRMAKLRELQQAEQPAKTSAAPAPKAATARPAAPKPALDPKPQAAPQAELAKALDSKDKNLADPLTANEPAASKPAPGAAMARSTVGGGAKLEGRQRRETLTDGAATTPVRMVCVTPDADKARARILAFVSTDDRAASRPEEKEDQKRKQAGDKQQSQTLTLTLTSVQLEALQRDLAAGGLVLVSRDLDQTNALAGKGGFGASAPEADSLKVAKSAKKSVVPATPAPVESKQKAEAAEEEAAKEQAPRQNAATQGKESGRGAVVHTVVIEFLAPPVAPADAAQKKE